MTSGSRSTCAANPARDHSCKRRGDPESLIFWAVADVQVAGGCMTPAAYEKKMCYVAVYTGNSMWKELVIPCAGEEAVGRLLARKEQEPEGRPRSTVLYAAPRALAPPRIATAMLPMPRRVRSAPSSRCGTSPESFLIKKLIGQAAITAASEQIGIVNTGKLNEQADDEATLMAAQSPGVLLMEKAGGERMRSAGAPWKDSSTPRTRASSCATSTTW
jgi:hypothetical protein